MNLLPIFLSAPLSERWTAFIEEKLPELWDMIVLLAGGFKGSLTIFALTLIFSLPLGVIVMFMRRSHFRPLSSLTKFYISIMRGTPLMLQLIVFYYGPYYIFKISLSKMPGNWQFLAIIVAFSLNYAAYFAEIFRGGLESIPVGQYEAAAVLDFGRARTFIHIILPQMVKNVLPAVTNETITLIKDTSLAFTLSYLEMFTLAKQKSASMVSPMPLFAAGIFYYVTNLLISNIMGFIEKKLDYYHV